jgi:hypothetical protein
MKIGKSRRMIRFSGKVKAASWIRSQGFVRFVGGSPAIGGGWLSQDGSQQARWIQLPGEEPAGLLIISTRGEVGYGD